PAQVSIVYHCENSVDIRDKPSNDARHSLRAKQGARWLQRQHQIIAAALAFELLDRVRDDRIQGDSVPRKTCTARQCASTKTLSDTSDLRIIGGDHDVSHHARILGGLDHPSHQRFAGYGTDVLSRNPF